MSSSRPYAEDEGRRRPSRAVRLALAFFFLTVFLVALGAAALVVDPGLAYVFPDPPAGQLQRFGDDVRASLAGLFADDGPLGAVRRLTEPYLTRFGLNLETVLIGAGLLLLAVLCIRVLAVTSRPPDENYAEDVFGPQREAAEGPPEASPYWPYDARPGRPPVGSERFSSGRVSPGALRARREPATAGVEPGPAAAPAYTGDAWPGTGARAPQEMPRERPPDEGPDEVFAESSETGPPEAPEEAVRTAAAEPSGEARVETAAAAEGAAAPAAALAYEAEGGEQPPVERRGEPRAEPVMYAPPRENAYPQDEARAARAYDEAWHGAPGPYPQGRGAAAAGRPVSAQWAGESPPSAPVQQARVQEVVVRARPPLRAGLRKFVVPGALLAALGAGGAYGLQTTYAAVLAASPYVGLILAGAAAGLGTLVAAWFSAGPMKAVAVRTAVPGPWAAEGPARAGVGAGPAPVGGASGARPAPGPGPAGGAGGSQPGSLETPDAADWSDFPKPSIFIPWSQNATWVGVDVGSAWTKVVQVGLSRYGYEIVNLGLCPTPEGSVADGAVVDPDAVGAALKDLLRSRNIIQRQVMAALGGQGIILRHVQFPRMDLDELREVIRWEAEHHIPIPPPEAVVDFTVIPGQGETDEQGTQQMRVMLVGAQRAVVEAYVSALKKARLVPRGLDIEALADYRVLNVPAYRSQDPTRYAEAVIDLGHSATKLSIYLRGVLELTRTLATGGRAFTEALSGGLGVPQVEAERLKRRYGVRADGGRVLQTLSPTLNDLVFEIRRTFEFFASRHFGQSVRRVYLVGGGARMPGVAEALTRYLTPALGERVPEGADVRVEVVDPLAAIPLSPRLARQAPFIGPEFVTALGLALSVEEEAYEG